MTFLEQYSYTTSNERMTEDYEQRRTMRYHGLF